jgi:hypothetical protein
MSDQPSPPDDGLKRIRPSDLLLPQIESSASRPSRPVPCRAVAPPACRHCSNSGHIKVDLATSLAEGLIVLETYAIGDRTIARIPCGCPFGAAVVGRWRNMPGDAAGVMLDTIAGVPEQDQAIAAIEEFIAHSIGWLTFAGGYGVGKTLLLYAALNHLADSGLYGCYLTAPDLIDQMRGLVREGGDGDARLRRYIEAPLLAVDELDKYDSTEFAEKTIFRLFHARYQSWQTKGTLMSYNLDRERRIPPFLQSRMHDSRFRHIVLAGSDLRPLASELDAWDTGEASDVAD